MSEPTPVYPMPRRALLALVASVVACLLLVIAGGVAGGLWLRSLAHENHQSIARLNRITNPTPEQFRQDLERGIKRCLQEPTCARLFPTIERARKARQRTATARLARQVARLHHYADVPPATLQPTSGSGGGSAPSAQGGRPSRPGPPSGGGGSQPGPAPSPAPSPPPQQHPLVNVPVPAPVTVCTPSLGVNC